MPGGDAVSARRGGTRRRRSAAMSPFARMVGWLVGAPLAAVRYLLVTRHVVDEQACESAGRDAAGDDLPALLRDCGQGHGALVRRRFSMRIVEPAISAEQLATIISSDPNLASPWEVLRWELPSGEPRRLRPGDEVLIRMAGPWNGPLRVVERESHRLRLRTLPGHALVGELELRVTEDERGMLAEIELWERPGSRVLAVLRDRIGVTTRMQTHTWTEFLQRTRAISGGRSEGSVRIRTERVST